MKTQAWIAAVGLAAMLSCALNAQAQYTDNGQTNLISGVNSNWPGDYYVGNFFLNDVLVVTNAGRLLNGAGYIGAEAGNSNYALVTGAGSVWNNSSDLYIGYYGSSNALTIANGGTVINNYGYIAIGGEFNNAVTVTGAGSVWSNRNDLYFGDSGPGNTLTINNGGAVIDNNSIIGWYAGASNNAVIVTGPGSVWTNSGTLDIGDHSAGNTLTIANGGKVFNGYGFVGFVDAGASNNSVTVTGFGSLWNNSYLYIGDYASGNSLTVSNGGAVFDLAAGIGLQPGANNNSVTVTGPGSVWSNSSDLYVGGAGSGNTLTITNQGSVTVGGTLTISAFAGSSNNAVNISGGQLIVTNAINVGAAGSAQLNISGGPVLAQQLFATNGANSLVNFSQGLLDLGAATVANGSAFNVGDGTNPATLNLRGGISSFVDELHVSSNALLTGSGTIISGNALIEQGGILSPGNGDSPGVFTFSNQLKVAGTLEIKLSNAFGALGTGDFMNVGGQLDVGGGLLDFTFLDAPTNSVYAFCKYGTLLGVLADTNNVPAGYVFESAYNGNELALVAIPEPVSLGILLLMGGGLLSWRRLRRWGT